MSTIVFQINNAFASYITHCPPSAHLSPVKVEKARKDAEDDTSQGSETKSDSNDQSSTLGLDSDPDYTLVGSSSPSHTEDRWVKLFLTLTNIRKHVSTYAVSLLYFLYLIF